MKAPDKIYRVKRTEEEPFFPGCWENQIEGCINIEYIRKDLLLEWAKNELENNVGQYHADYNLAFSKLIDKLNTITTKKQ